MQRGFDERSWQADVVGLACLLIACPVSFLAKASAVLTREVLYRSFDNGVRTPAQLVLLLT